MSGDALRNAWVDFLSPHPWDWFCTLTFRTFIHPEAAFKRFRFWVNDLNRDLYGKRWKEKGHGVYWVLASEFQRRGVLHFHALVSGAGIDLNNHAKRLHYMDTWHALAGIARIEEPRSGAVVNYCSKYCAKGGDIELSDNLRAMFINAGAEYSVRQSIIPRD